MTEPAVPERVPWYRPVFLPRDVCFVLGIAVAVGATSLASLLVREFQPPRPVPVRIARWALLATPFVVAGVLALLRRRGGRRHPWLALALGAHVAMVVATGNLFGFGAYVRRNEFDPDRWRRSGAQAGERARLIHDLLESRILERRTRSEVDALLGPDVVGARHGELAYLVGESFPTDSEWLRLTFDTDDRVERARIVTD